LQEAATVPTICTYMPVKRAYWDSGRYGLGTAPNRPGPESPPYHLVIRGADRSDAK
jgi:hypothetical protein